MWNLEDVDETHRWNIDCVEHRRSHGLVDLMWTWTSKMWMACGHGHRGCAQWMECGHRGCDLKNADRDCETADAISRTRMRSQDRGDRGCETGTVDARPGLRPLTASTVLGCGLSPRLPGAPPGVYYSSVL